MNILHISDLHFGPRHWDGNDNLLLEKIEELTLYIIEQEKRMIDQDKRIKELENQK